MSTGWTINTNVTMILFIFIFLFVGDMIIFVVTNPIYIRDRNSDEIDVGKLLLATFIAASFGVVIIWLISVLIRAPSAKSKKLNNIEHSNTIGSDLKDKVSTDQPANL